MLKPGLTLCGTIYVELTLAVYYSVEVSYRRRKFKNEKSISSLGISLDLAHLPHTPPAHWHCTLLTAIGGFPGESCNDMELP
jgi:hypothetical protein